jgi:hypothetical protein
MPGKGDGAGVQPGGNSEAVPDDLLLLTGPRRIVLAGQLSHTPIHSPAKENSRPLACSLADAITRSRLGAPAAGERVSNRLGLLKCPDDAFLGLRSVPPLCLLLSRGRARLLPPGGGTDPRVMPRGNCSSFQVPIRHRKEGRTSAWCANSWGRAFATRSSALPVALRHVNPS